MLYVTGLALVTGAVIGWASGGRLRFIGQHRIQAWWLVVLGFGLQVAADRINIGTAGSALVVVGAAALLVFAVMNPSLIGIGVIAVGVAVNGLVIGLDNGMPVRPGAVVAAGIATPAQVPTLDYGYRHHAEGSRDELRVLDDRIPLSPVREVVSFGDLILAVGVAATVAHLFHPLPHHTRST